MMRKVYVQSARIVCPFCGKHATGKNPDGLLVCRHHKNDTIQLQCACGKPLDVRESKYGTYFLCENCGPINYRKGLGINGLPLPSVDEL